MAKKEIYICDSCRKELGNNDHLSFNFNGANNGWVKQSKVENEDTGDFYEGWRYFAPIPKGGIYQFCDFKCMDKYFEKIKQQCQIKKLKQ